MKSSIASRLDLLRWFSRILESQNCFESWGFFWVLCEEGPSRRISAFLPARHPISFRCYATAIIIKYPITPNFYVHTQFNEGLCIGQMFIGWWSLIFFWFMSARTLKSNLSFLDRWFFNYFYDFDTRVVFHKKNQSLLVHSEFRGTGCDVDQPKMIGLKWGIV